MCFTFILGWARRTLGWAGPTCPPPPLCYALELKLKEMDGVEILQHPAYSPDVAPSDYGLFQAWSIFFEGKIWKYGVEIECRNFFASKTTTGTVTRSGNYWINGESNQTVY
jgi:hypothetical protein